MRTPLFAMLAAATMLAGPVLAQAAIDPQTGRTTTAEEQRGYVGVPSPNEPAVDAAQKPVTSALNAQVAAGSQVDTAAVQLNAEQQAQYDADRTQYINALIRHDAAVDRTDARYVRQQRAYADAMAVWRVQVAECKKGRQAACRMPPPNVSDYY